jgi:hypothetical protein
MSQMSSSHVQGTPPPAQPAGRHDVRSWHLVLAALLGVALILRLVMWKVFPNIHAADEIFQYQEPALRAIDGYGVVTWEYIEGVRSWAVPGALAGLLWLSKTFLGGIEAWGLLVAMALSILSLSIVWAMATYGRWLWGLPGAVVGGGVGVVWYEFVYFAPKALTSPIAAHLIVLAFIVWGLGIERVSSARLGTGAAVAGLALIVRPQLGLGLAVLTVAVLLHHGWRIALPWVAAGGLVMFAVAGLWDLAAFDYPYQWLVETYRFQIDLGIFNSFGVEPWDWYIRWMATTWLYVAPVFAALFVVGARLVPAPTIAALAIAATHMALGHKEYRFLYPALALGLIVSTVGLVRICKALCSRSGWAGRPQWVLVALAVTIVGFTSAERSFSQRYSLWDRNSITVEAFGLLHDDSTLQSLVLDGVNWTSTPGYTGLLRDVPLRIVLNGEDLSDLAGNYTHVLSTRDQARMPTAHELVQSWPIREGLSLNLFRYTGAYQQPDDMLINDQIDAQWSLFKRGVSDRLAP